MKICTLLISFETVKWNISSETVNEKRIFELKKVPENLFNQIMLLSLFWRHQNFAYALPKAISTIRRRKNTFLRCTLRPVTIFGNWKALQKWWKKLFISPSKLFSFQKIFKFLPWHFGHVEKQGFTQPSQMLTSV